MKTKLVDTVTTNEDHVRSRPFMDDWLIRYFQAGGPDLQPPKFETTNQQQET